MHGRPRKAPTSEEQEAYAIKASKLRSLQSQFLQFHHSNIYTKEALDHNLNLPEVENNEESIKSILDEELRLGEMKWRRWLGGGFLMVVAFAGDVVWWWLGGVAGVAVEAEAAVTVEDEGGAGGGGGGC
ncbi:hypothetical protein RND71_009553 [Anisodus tanguticus]|uniref:Uncharacterized protein n=1 Tax=Anisodus tanguticus TaxID=243964 RepID=A0AAE1SFM8_9SOLA|nr:hypothetical protein RND71_009553 [Anisodus tanguticus]